MKIISFSVLIALATAGAANAECFADYKAKRDNPLRLHYGVAQVRSTCNPQAAADELRPRLASDGWQLLNVLGVFEGTELDERKESAGEYFLRY